MGGRKEKDVNGANSPSGLDCTFFRHRVGKSLIKKQITQKLIFSAKSQDFIRMYRNRIPRDAKLLDFRGVTKRKL